MSPGDARTTTPRGAQPIDWLALGAALITVVLWASAFVGIRALADDLSPASFALGRIAVASVALAIFVALRRPAMPRGRDLLLVAASGVIWFAAYFVALNAGEGLVDAGTAAMLVNVGPILIAVFAGIFLGEGFPPRLAIGSVIAFAGAVVISVATGANAAEPAAPLGVVLCLAAALAYAAGVTLQKPVVGRVPALAVTWAACTIGAVALLPFAPLLVTELATASMEAIAWIVYLGIFPTAVAFTTWAYALRRTTAGQLGSTTYLVPPVAILMAWVMLGEVPPALTFVGGILCIGGVIIARSRGRLHFRPPKARRDGSLPG